MRYLLILSLLNACTVNVVDRRLTREEVAAALQERDQVIAGIAEKVEELSAQAAKAK